MPIKWPEKRKKSTNGDWTRRAVEDVENNGWNACLEACRKALLEDESYLARKQAEAFGIKFKQSPPLVALDKESVADTIDEAERISDDKFHGKYFVNCVADLLVKKFGTPPVLSVECKHDSHVRLGNRQWCSNCGAIAAIIPDEKYLLWVLPANAKKIRK